MANTEQYPPERLQRRLATGLGNKGGARGSLTRCAGRLSGLKRALAADDTTTTTTLIPEACDGLSRELQLAGIELTKLYLMAQRQEEELEDLDDATTGSSFENGIAAERLAVQSLRQELQRASMTVAAKAEYEQTATLLCSQHPTSAAILQSEIDALEAGLKRAKTQLQTAHSQKQVRHAQFQLLLQCMTDLKQSLAQPLVNEDCAIISSHPDINNDDEQDATGDEHDDNDEKGTDADDKPRSNNDSHHPTPTTHAIYGNSKNDTSREPVMMEEGEEDEEGALYEDL